ncbi:hypothetical protein F2Q69_00052902 [Brassica cretica]|uniref:Uncharacterized protein n=1 Tax=Brassica cretica TaxID=69181 RepID=A0A8S9MQC9_BRACR|nr:hypothetical protein F2Q69_00052902 [Brassica cretica]
MLRIDSRTRYLMQKTTSSHCESNVLTKFSVSALAWQHGSSVDRCYGMSVDRCYVMSVDQCYVGHNICSARILSLPLIDTKAVSSINGPSSPRQLSLARQTDNSSVKQA